MKYDPQLHHRRSIRLKGYDYSQPGAYFVTICTFQHVEIFGEMVEGEMRLSPLGEIVRTEWFQSAEIRKEICLFEDEFVVMPNHLHGIVRIVDHSLKVGSANTGAIPGTVDGRENNQEAPLANTPDADVTEAGVENSGAANLSAGNQGACHAPLRRAARSLSSLVGGFKGVVTSRARKELGIANIWQRNYYEHIIRNESEWEKIWHYIDTNPQGWEGDSLHPSAPANQLNRR